MSACVADLYILLCVCIALNLQFHTCYVSPRPTGAGNSCRASTCLSRLRTSPGDGRRRVSTRPRVGQVRPPPFYGLMYSRVPRATPRRDKQYLSYCQPLHYPAVISSAVSHHFCLNWKLDLTCLVPHLIRCYP